MSAATSPRQQTPTWHQVTVEFTDYALAEQATVAHLQPIMDSAVESWWFIRKAPCWRLRYRPPRHDTEDDVRDNVHQAMATLRAADDVAGWVETIYEPEVHVFGGHDAMTVAHQLFHHDSQHILSRRSSDRDHRQELTILLCSTFLRAAGQDWYEQGDVWARVAENRPVTSETPPERTRALEPGLRRLMTVDAGPGSPLVEPGGHLADIATWTTAFHTAGRALGELASRGELRRGLRAVLAHHLIFHWNRLGLSYNTQSILASAAREMVLGG